MRMLNIAVIGAGAAGLCVARHVASRPNMKAMVFEQSSAIGGAWVYCDEIDKDKNGLHIHSAMYRNLKTNLPKEVMSFPDFPFDDKLPSFLTHEQVLDYLEQYCKHFKLEKYIQLETLVKCVKPIPSSDGQHIWEVTVKNLKQGTETVAKYDAVFVCNGHYAKSYIPEIPGQQDFEGLVMHSHSYRYPELFSEKRVVLLGCRSSGQDISLDIAKHAKTVVISHRGDFLTCPLPDNVSQAPTVSRFEEDGKTVCFVDGSKTEADAFVYCTGYEYQFPFLDETCNIVIDQKRIKYLYNHIVNLSHPSMFFIGICSRICPFPQFHFQTLFGLAAFEGAMKLPTKAEMLEEIERDYQDRLKKGWPHRATHTLGPLQWNYNNKIADAAGVPRLHLRVEQLYQDTDRYRKSMLCGYKDSEVRLREDGFYELDVQDK